MIDLAVAAFVALLVFGGLHVPRVADAIGRTVQRLRGQAPSPRPSPPLRGGEGEDEKLRSR